MRKICSKCKHEKDISCFCKHNGNKDGYNYWCKECSYRSSSKWAKKNSDKIREYSKKWHRDNPEKAIKKAQKWRKNNKNHIRQYWKDYDKNKPRNRWAIGTLSRHKSKGFLIRMKSIDLIKIAYNNENCAICGKLLRWERGYGKCAHDSPTLDRIDNENFIDVNNTQILCHRCNTAKGDLDMSSFVSYCEMVVKKFTK